jgi:uncharacterized protein with HEPN domain
MDSTKRDISVLEHIVKWCDDIVETHEYFGDTFEALQENKHYFKSVSMSLLQIGELVNHLSKELTEKYSNVIWRKIVGLRNMIVHGYGKLLFTIIWDVSHNQVLELKNQCSKIISEINI